MRKFLSISIPLFIVISLIVVALIGPTPLWRQVIMTLVAFSLIAAALFAVQSSGALRVFARGFGIAGLIYFALAFTSVVNVRQHLFTQSILTQVYPDQSAQQMQMQGVVQTPTSTSLFVAKQPLAANTQTWTMSLQGIPGVANPTPVGVDIGHACCTLALGLFGGALALAIYRREQRDAELAAD
ncbi:MAG: hypothetical protein QGG36_16575 [Pirellulaceae bacterium]|jgi:hypothetical protein|nr:hypothetical protein [Pirellulaceae bacterium]MDP7017422.1 hypothetical protein [Pirellulaceae bacterium]